MTTIHDIFRAVELVTGINKSQITGTSKKDHIVFARHMVAAEVKKIKDDERFIAEVINRHRTTVYSSINEHNNLIVSNMDYRQAYRKVEFRISSFVLARKMAPKCYTVPVKSVIPI